MADAGNSGEPEAGSADAADGGAPSADGPKSEPQEETDSGGCACASVGI